MQKQILIAVVLGASVARADFGSDTALLKKHTDVIVLSDKTGRAQVAVVPQYQGRVMTSTANGAKGTSFGWINKKAIADGKRQPHINVFGGEDRIWFGPEGGQYSLFFPKGKPFDFKYWQTPAPIDWGGWKMTTHTRDRAAFSQNMSLTNYAGTKLNLRANREVRLLNQAQLASSLGGSTRGLRVVGFETDNRITNTGRAAWTKKTGMPSIWILGMMNPSPDTTVVVPFVPGPESKLGRIVNDAYFGKVPATNLKVDERKGVLFFKADGKKRSKIGIPPRRAKNVLGSYDSAGKTLTLVELTLPRGARDYVNSMWETQKNPFAGDAVNSYNDGPLADGTQLGPFYEIESSSPAAALKPGQTMRHLHRTIHIQGPEAVLDKIARRKLGASLSEIKTALIGMALPAGALKAEAGTAEIKG